MKSVDKQLLFIVLGAPVAIFLAVFLYFAFQDTVHPKSRSEQVLEQCREQFADEGNEQVYACANTILIHELDQSERDKLSRAAQ